MLMFNLFSRSWKSLETYRVSKLAGFFFIKSILNSFL